MTWVVDTCVLLDVLEDDPEFGRASALALDEQAPEGLVVCPVTYVELAPAFDGNTSIQDEFLAGIGVDFREDWKWEDTLRSHGSWHRFIQKKRSGIAQKRPLADILIGAFALGHQGLITRNPEDFRAIFPELSLRVPPLEG